MGSCLSLKCTTISNTKCSVTEHDNVWEFKHADLVTQYKLISEDAFSKPPSLCNYLILFRNENKVVRCKISFSKKYRTTESLSWHLSLVGLPATAKLYLSDNHYKILYNNDTAMDDDII